MQSLRPPGAVPPIESAFPLFFFGVLIQYILNFPLGQLLQTGESFGNGPLVPDGEFLELLQCEVEAVGGFLVEDAAEGDALRRVIRVFIDELDDLPHHHGFEAAFEWFVGPDPGDVFVAPYFELVVIRDVKHGFSDVKVAEFLVQQFEALQGDIVEVEGVVEGDVLDPGEVGVDPLIENADFGSDVRGLLGVFPIQGAHQQRMLVPELEVLDLVPEVPLGGYVDLVLNHRFARAIVFPDAEGVGRMLQAELGQGWLMVVHGCRPRIGRLVPHLRLKYSNIISLLFYSSLTT